MVGAYERHHRYSALQQLLQNSPARDAIHLLGYISDEHLAELMQLCTCLLFPSQYEGFGLPAIEAMAAGLPVLGSDGGALGEVIGAGGIVVPVNNEEQFAHELSSIVTDRTQRAQMQRAGLARAGQYRWSETARRTIEGYQRVWGL